MRGFVSRVIKTPVRGSVASVGVCNVRRGSDERSKASVRARQSELVPAHPGGAERDDDERADSCSIRKVDGAWRRLFGLESSPAASFLGWKSKRANETRSGERVSFVGELGAHARGVTLLRSVRRKWRRSARLWNWRPCDLKCRVARPTSSRVDHAKGIREGFRFSMWSNDWRREQPSRRRFSLT